MDPVYFSIFSRSHTIVLVLTFLISLGLISIVRHSQNEKVEYVSRYTLFIVFLLIFISRFIYKNYNQNLSLPMHLCDWAAIMVMVALLFKSDWAFELAYFWGLAGTLQALITPDIRYDFPHTSFIMFFVFHSGVIVGVFFLIFASKMSLRDSALNRVFLRTQIYLITALIINILFDSNYGYLLQKPSKSTLFDYLGPWPLYILSLEVIAYVSFIISYLPFYFINKQKVRSS